MRDRSTSFLAAIWPVRPSDVLTVAVFVVLLSFVGYSQNGGQPSWAWWWAGAALGELIVIVMIARRVRRRDAHEPADRRATRGG